MAINDTRLETWIIPNNFAQETDVSDCGLVDFPNFVPFLFGLKGFAKLGYQKAICSHILSLLLFVIIAPFYHDDLSWREMEHLF